jgi:hypothetical protein
MPGRPSVITPKTVSKLIASFNLGCSIREACWQSGVSHEALKAKEVVIAAFKSPTYIADITTSFAFKASCETPDCQHASLMLHPKLNEAINLLTVFGVITDGLPGIYFPRQYDYLQNSSIPLPQWPAIERLSPSGWQFFY